MEMVRHKIFGIGYVMERVKKNGITYLIVQFGDGREMKLSIPSSFELGVVEPLGSLQEEVDDAIASRIAKEAAAKAAAIPVVPAAPVRTAARSGRKASTIPAGPEAAAFEQYLIAAGYKLMTDKGASSTVGAYVNAVDTVRTREGLSWSGLKKCIGSIVAKYDVGGPMDWFGSKSNETVINALRRYAEFLSMP